MDDLIRRRDVIEHLKKRLYETELNSTAEHPYYEEIADNRVDIWMNELPSAQPQRKKGKWVGYDGDWLKTMCKCSECGAMIDINEKYRNFFCYHCGARMEGE